VLRVVVAADVLVALHLVGVSGATLSSTMIMAKSASIMKSGRLYAPVFLQMLAFT
jgi:hypothetical protein